MKNISYIELVGFCISLFNFIAGFLLWYSASVQKNYSAKRDFEHLKRHYEQLAANQVRYIEDLDRLSDSLMLDMRDVKNSVNVLIVKLLPGMESR